MIVKREIEVDAFADVTLAGKEVELADVPANLNWELEEDFRDGKYMKYRFWAPGSPENYHAELLIRNEPGRGKIDTDDADDVLEEIIVAAIEDKKAGLPAGFARNTLPVKIERTFLHRDLMSCSSSA